MDVTRTACSLHTSYDPFEDALSRGVRVGFLEVSTAGGLWIPGRNAIIVSSHVGNQADRADMLSHMLGHADIEGSRALARYRQGVLTADDLERRICARVARRIISPVALEAALRVSHCARSVALLLGVTLRTLLQRVQALTRDERWAFGRSVDRLQWPPERPAELPPCLHEGRPPARNPERRAVAAAAAAALAVGLLIAETTSLLTNAPFP